MTTFLIISSLLPHILNYTLSFIWYSRRLTHSNPHNHVSLVLLTSLPRNEEELSEESGEIPNNRLELISQLGISAASALQWEMERSIWIQMKLSALRNGENAKFHTHCCVFHLDPMKPVLYNWLQSNQSFQERDFSWDIDARDEQQTKVLSIQEWPQLYPSKFEEKLKASFRRAFASQNCLYPLLSPAGSVSNQFCIWVSPYCPGITSELLRNVQQLLLTHDCVLGPVAASEQSSLKGEKHLDTTGECYLIGIRKFAEWESVFNEVCWGTDMVQQQIMDNITENGKSVCLLTKRAEVRTVQDLKSWEVQKERNRKLQSGCAITICLTEKSPLVSQALIRERLLQFALILKNRTLNPSLISSIDIQLPNLEEFTDREALLDLVTTLAGVSVGIKQKDGKQSNSLSPTPMILSIPNFASNSIQLPAHWDQFVYEWARLQQQNASTDSLKLSKLTSFTNCEATIHW